jgi:hypothetical protein
MKEIVSLMDVHVWYLKLQEYFVLNPVDESLASEVSLTGTAQVLIWVNIYNFILRLAHKPRNLFEPFQIITINSQATTVMTYNIYHHFPENMCVYGC